jgi:hypothetical protein
MIQKKQHLKQGNKQYNKTAKRAKTKEENTNSHTKQRRKNGDAQTNRTEASKRHAIQRAPCPFI